MPPPLPAAKMDGNSTPPCVCNGPPPASNVDTLTLAAAAAAAAFVNPATVHTTAAVGDKGAAAVDRLSSSTPVDKVKAADTATVDGLRLEQLGAAALALTAVKRRPVMEIVLNEVALCAAAAMNDALAVTWVAPAR